jgi:hypothetical protein
MNHERGIKGFFINVLFVAKKVLQVGVLPDLLYCFLIGKPQCFLDNQGAEGHPSPLGYIAGAAGEKIGVVAFDGALNNLLFRAFCVVQEALIWIIEGS